MSSEERRLEARKPISLHVRFRVRNSASLHMYRGQTVNMSDHGIYFRTPRPLTVGDALEVVLTLPSEVTGRPAEEVRCHARVVRVDWINQADACAAAGIEIQKCEKASAGAQWTN